MSLKISWRIFLGALLVSNLLFLSCGAGEKTSRWNSPPKMSIDVNKKYTAIIKTARGDLVVELFARDVPVTVNNFVFLARQGYYDNTTFHRVIPDFVAQGGDPTGTGLGGPGYTFANEITSHKHIPGAISMAHSDLPTSNGSQFFICYQAQPGLDGSFSVFGQLVAGMDVLLTLTPRDPDMNPQFDGDKVITVTILEE